MSGALSLVCLNIGWDASAHLLDPEASAAGKQVRFAFPGSLCRGRQASKEDGVAALDES
jgi:hypothetical protein